MRIKENIFYFLPITIALVAGIIYQLPATLIDYSLQKKSSGILRLTDTSGTLWRGQGTLEAKRGSITVGHIANIRWDWRPTEILEGKLSYVLWLDSEDLPSKLELNFQGFRLLNLSAQLPIQLVEIFYPQATALKLGGYLKLQIPELAVGVNGLTVLGQIEWMDASSSLTKVAPLGNYKALIKSDRDLTTFDIQTLSGPLTLSGGGAINLTSNSELTIKARVRDEFSFQLSPVLRLIAKELAPNYFEISASKSLTLN